MRLRGGFQQKLGHVLAGGTLNPASSKVVDDGGAVLADGTKVKDVTAGVEGEDLVELLDKVRAGLVDRAHDGLAGGAQLAQETDDGHG